MKIHRLDAHDRFQEFKKQGDEISRGCLDCIKMRPKAFENHPFYIFAHKREIGTDERVAIFNYDMVEASTNPSYTRQYTSIDQVPTARMIWQPRLTKPQPQTNSMLFKFYPLEDVIKIIWMLPDQALWGQYQKGNMTENQLVCESIEKFQKNWRELAAEEEDDLPESAVNAIYAKIRNENGL